MKPEYCWIPYDSPEWKQLVSEHWHTVMLSSAGYALMQKEKAI